MLNTPHPTSEQDRLLILEEAALLAHVSVGTIRRWITSGLPALHSGRVLVRESDLLAYMKRAK